MPNTHIHATVVTANLLLLNVKQLYIRFGSAASVVSRPFPSTFRCKDI